MKVKKDQTGTGTLSIFAPRPLKFKLNDNGRPILPLLTTKRVFTRAIIAELLWFIEGSTSSLPLSEAGVKIWDGNGSREFLDSRGLTHRELYQRSCDMGLGVPFNIASYALLCHMIAHVTDLVPGSLTHTMGDAHVYLDHVDALRTQLEREPRKFPDLEIKREKGGSIDGWKAEDFEIKGYEPQKSIAMKMSV
ncbi:putative Thymidylate synthase [Glarea lozoyensis 74030]|uniref:thymidylate synthase n=1 Tax=Glarea lozoyensis (strain ATCC 74030 / MF5533) TaxID=1104152 RepID=H0EKQ6_GLAL7|nr:putative Thymidylate synthase [Glarea lozoyensis 74030]